MISMIISARAPPESAQAMVAPASMPCTAVCARQPDGSAGPPLPAALTLAETVHAEGTSPARAVTLVTRTAEPEAKPTQRPTSSRSEPADHPADSSTQPAATIAVRIHAPGLTAPLSAQAPKQATVSSLAKMVASMTAQRAQAWQRT